MEIALWLRVLLKKWTLTHIYSSTVSEVFALRERVTYLVQQNISNMYIYMEVRSHSPSSLRLCTKVFLSCLVLFCCVFSIIICAQADSNVILDKNRSGHRYGNGYGSEKLAKIVAQTHKDEEHADSITLRGQGIFHTIKLTHKLKFKSHKHTKINFPFFFFNSLPTQCRLTI